MPIFEAVTVGAALWLFPWLGCLWVLVCVASYREVTGIIGIQLASLLRGKPRSREYLVATWTNSGTRVVVTVGRISVGRPFTRDAHRTGARERVSKRAGGDTTWTRTSPGGSMQDLHGSGKVHADARTPQMFVRRAPAAEFTAPPHHRAQSRTHTILVHVCVCRVLWRGNRYKSAPSLPLCSAGSPAAESIW